jgi:hypothetical protein
MIVDVSNLAVSVRSQGKLGVNVRSRDGSQGKLANFAADNADITRITDVPNFGASA